MTNLIPIKDSSKDKFIVLVLEMNKNHRIY